MRSSIVEKTASWISLLFSVFPIKRNKLFFMSYYGANYGCNPKYITEYILGRTDLQHFKLIWVVNDKNKREKESRFTEVRSMSFAYFYHLATSRVIITNHRMPPHFLKRKNQYYIQTWHSSLRLKTIESDAGDALPADYIEQAKEDSKKLDLLLSGCQKSTDIFKTAFWYEGEIFSEGTPRNDLLVNADLYSKNKIKEKLGIAEEQKVVLFAPTFRNKKQTKDVSLNYDRLLSTLQARDGGEWKCLVKLHPHEAAVKNKSEKNILDLTAYGDTQELLLIADILITDYSSLMFDYAVTKKPCFLYVPDFEEYISNERALYFSLDELPFLPSYAEAELMKQINELDEKVYEQGIMKFNRRIGTFEKGVAAEKLVERLIEICEMREMSSIEAT